MKYFTGWNTSWSMGLCLTWSNTSWCLCFRGSNPEVLACVLQDEMSYRIKYIMKYGFVSYRMKYLLKCGFVSYRIKSWGMGLCLTGSNTFWMWRGRLTTSSLGCSTTATSVSTTKRTLNWWNIGSKLTNLSTKQGEEHKTYKFINKARWGNTKLTNLSTKRGEGAQNLQIYPQSEVREHKTYKCIKKVRWRNTKLKIYQQSKVREHKT